MSKIRNFLNQLNVQSNKLAPRLARWAHFTNEVWDDVCLRILYLSDDYMDIPEGPLRSQYVHLLTEALREMRLGHPNMSRCLHCAQGIAVGLPDGPEQFALEAAIHRHLRQGERNGNQDSDQQPTGAYSSARIR